MPKGVYPRKKKATTAAENQGTDATKTIKKAARKAPAKPRDKTAQQQVVLQDAQMQIDSTTTSQNA